MKISCKKCVSYASKIFLFASLFIFTSAVVAQTNVYVGDEEVIISPLSEGYEEEIDMRVEDESSSMEMEESTSSNSDSVEVHKQESTVTTNTVPTKSIQTAPTEAPDSGPKEALIISIAVLVGLVFATYFLFKNIKKYNS